MKQPDQLVTLDDLAKRLQVSVATVRLWIKRGIIPQDKYIAVDRTYRFDADGVIEHMLSQEKDPDQASEEAHADAR